jgi:four helix bundle protein
MEAKFQDFTKLEVYKAARQFRKDISLLVKKNFPSNEKYLLSAQILDASRSITANIAEGHGRFYFQENLRFCRIARGSLSETLEHLITAYDEEYITNEVLVEQKKNYDNLLKLLNGYIKHLGSKSQG